MKLERNVRTQEGTQDITEENFKDDDQKLLAWCKREPCVRVRNKARFDVVRKADGWCPDILIKMKAIQYMDGAQQMGSMVLYH